MVESSRNVQPQALVAVLGSNQLRDQGRLNCCSYSITQGLANEACQ